MKTKWGVCFLFAMAMVLGGRLGWAENVVITPLGAQEGEFCVGDRALLFEDPTGVRVLIAPGRTVRGSSDPRLGGRVDVLLIDHPHTDHLGNVLDTNCSGSTTAPFEFPAQGNAPEIAARLNSAVVVGGEMGSYFTQKILNIRGTAPPTASPRSSPISTRDGWRSRWARPASTST